MMDIIKSIERRLVAKAKDSKVTENQKKDRRKFLRNFGLGVAGAAVATPAISRKDGSINENFSGSWQEGRSTVVDNL